MPPRKKTTADIKPLTFEERNEREQAISREWQQQIQRRRSPVTTFVLRTGDNSEVFRGSENLCHIQACQEWARWEHNPAVIFTGRLPRALIKINEWGDEIPIGHYPANQEVIWDIQEGARTA